MERSGHQGQFVVSLGPLGYPGPRTCDKILWTELRNTRYAPPPHQFYRSRRYTITPLITEATNSGVETGSRLGKLQTMVDLTGLISSPMFVNA